MVALSAVVVLALAVALLDLLLILGIVRRMRADNARRFVDGPGPDVGSGPRRGSRLPRFAATTITGSAVDDSRYADGSGCVAFVSATCVPCEGALSDLGPYLREAGIDSEHTVIVVADDAEGTTAKTRRAREFAQVVIGEPADELVGQFGIGGFPTLIVVRDGVVAASAHAVSGLPTSLAVAVPVGE